MLLTLKTWELLSTIMVSKTVDDAMILLSKARAEETDTEYSLDGSHIKRLVKEFLAPHPDIHVEGYSHASLVSKFPIDWSDPDENTEALIGETIEISIECSYFDVSPGETMWLVLNQAEFDSDNWHVLDKYCGINSLFSCRLLERIGDRHKAYNWRRWKKIDARIRVEILQAIPFRQFEKYFPCPRDSPTWRTLIRQSDFEGSWENPYQDIPIEPFDSDGDSDESTQSEWRPYHRIQCRTFGTMADDGQEFRFIKLDDSWYCFLVFSYATLYNNFRFQCHLYQVPSEDVELFDLENPLPHGSQWETNDAIRRLEEEYSGTQDWNTAFERRYRINP